MAVEGAKEKGSNGKLTIKMNEVTAKRITIGKERTKGIKRAMGGKKERKFAMHRREFLWYAQVVGN